MGREIGDGDATTSDSPALASSSFPRRSSRRVFTDSLGDTRYASISIVMSATSRRQALAACLLGTEDQIGAREREVALGVSYHRVGGLETFDALSQRLHRGEIGPGVRGQALRQVGDVGEVLRQVLLQSKHRGDEGGQSVEVGGRVGPYPGRLHAPLRARAAVWPERTRSRHGSARRGRRESANAARHRHRAAEPRTLYRQRWTPISLVGPSRLPGQRLDECHDGLLVRVRGPARPSWNSNIASTASRRVAALPSCRYGAVWAAMRRLGTLKACRSSSLPVTLYRPMSAFVMLPRLRK